jgi:ZIP family zinc transporter
MLALAAGAMIYVVFDELLPDTARHGDERPVAISVLVGILVLFVLQNYVAELLA